MKADVHDYLSVIMVGLIATRGSLQMLQEPVLLSVVFTIYKGSWDTSKHFIALFRVLNNSQNIIIHVLILTISYNKLCSLVVSNQSNAIYELVHRELILDWRCSIWQATV